MVNTWSTKGYGSVTDVSYEAEAAMANNYVPVKLWTAANEVNIATANTDVVVWFIQNEQATAGEMAMEQGLIGLLLTGDMGWVTNR